MQINPYLLFTGQCEEAFKFYEKLLGGKIQVMRAHEDTPAGSQVPAEWQKKILHARMTTPGGALMGSDAPPGRQAKPQGFSVSLSGNSTEKTKQVWDALADGATISLPLDQAPWGGTFGMLVDRYGIPWMLHGDAE